jgi:hypothetical protein
MSEVSFPKKNLSVRKSRKYCAFKRPCADKQILDRGAGGYKTKYAYVLCTSKEDSCNQQRFQPVRVDGEK